MVNVLFFTLSDLGKNARMINLIDELRKRKNLKIFLFGFDISELPKQVRDSPNIVINHIFRIFTFPWYLSLCFVPLQFLFYLIQVFSISIVCKSVDVVFTSSSYLEIFLSMFLSLIKKSRLVIDIDSLDWFRNSIKKKIYIYLLSHCDYLTTETHSMSVILRISGIKSFEIPNLPDKLFLNIKKSKEHVCKILSIPKESKLIGIPILYYGSSIFERISRYSKIFNDLDNSFVFIIFADLKLQKEIKEQLSNIKFKNPKFILIPFIYNIYPLVLSSCDIGLSINGEDSSLKISKEIIQMYGSGIPIIGFKGVSMNEIIKNGGIGFIAKDDNDLIKLLKDIFITHEININNLKFNKEEIIKKWNINVNKIFDLILN